MTAPRSQTYIVQRDGDRVNGIRRRAGEEVTLTAGQARYLGRRVVAKTAPAGKTGRKAADKAER